MKTITELKSFRSYEDCVSYLQIHGKVGEDTFGWDRWINQKFYRSKEWRQLRDRIISRDDGCDMGLKSYPIMGQIIIHHINPIFVTDITDVSILLMDPDNLVCVSDYTHKLIHFGGSIVNPYLIKERSPGDTKLW